jgi:tRNA-binding EMAP/Myf-like protein
LTVSAGIVIVVVLGAFALVGLVTLLVYRGDRAGVVRRRDLENVRRDHRQALLTLYAIQRTITLWRPSVTDDVGVGFVDAVQKHVNDFHATVLQVDDDDQEKRKN